MKDSPQWPSHLEDLPFFLLLKHLQHNKNPFFTLQGRRFRSGNRHLPRRTSLRCGGPRGPWSSRAARRRRTRRSTGRSASASCTCWLSSPTRSRSWSCGCRRTGSCRRTRTTWTATCSRYRCKPNAKGLRRCQGVVQHSGQVIHLRWTLLFF